MRARIGEALSSALIANGVQTFGHHPKDGAPQGLFCANGQCSHCLVMVDSLPEKACLTPVTAGMKVSPLDALPSLKAEDRPLPQSTGMPTVETEVLIVGGGPAGLTAAVELGSNGVKCILCDDKEVLGGKLNLQTDNFFGSARECYAGKRGMDIPRTLEEQVRSESKVTLWTDSPVVGVFADGAVGVVRRGVYTLVKTRKILVATGARERTLAFPGGGFAWGLWRGGLPDAG